MNRHLRSMAAAFLLFAGTSSLCAAGKAATLNDAAKLNESATPDKATAPDNAQELFDQAIRLIENEKLSDGRDLFVRSAELFEKEASDDWRLWYQAGNARWWAGQADIAIRDYRRYLAHDSFRPEVWENLDNARRTAGTTAPSNEGFLSWPWFLWFASGAAFFIGMSALFFSVYLFSRSFVWRKITFVCAFLFIFFGIISAAAFWSRGTVAVLARETQGFKGDSGVYAHYPDIPWKAGQEVLIQDEKDTWTRIRVGDIVSWVPALSLVRMDK